VQIGDQHILPGNDQIAKQCDRQADAQGIAIDHGDDRLSMLTMVSEIAVSRIAR
jgi:hypothetical protein